MHFLFLEKCHYLIIGYCKLADFKKVYYNQNWLSNWYTNILGGLAETPLHGGLVGPTFACIIGIQFRNLRKCDRFWYENGNPLIRFTEAQLAEIRKVTLSKVICNNCDQVTNIQRAMFDIPDPFLNPRVPCNALPEINLELWKERVACNVGGTTINTGKKNILSHFVTQCFF